MDIAEKQEVMQRLYEDKEKKLRTKVEKRPYPLKIRPPNNSLILS